MSNHQEECEVLGQVVKIHCEANQEYYLTAREYDDVVLAPGDERDPCQQWIMDVTWGTRVKDGAGFPAFALVNKATHQALRHGSEENEKVNTCPYSREELDETVLWTQSDDVGNGYQCIRPVDNIHLNLDADHGDQESGGIQEGTNLVLFKWKKQENQKWKITPICDSISQSHNYEAEHAHYGGRTNHGEGNINYGTITYGSGKYGEEEATTCGGGVNFGGTRYGAEETSYEGAPTYVEHTSQQHTFPEHMPEGQVVRLYCEANPDFYLTIRDWEVVLAPGDAYDVSQQWIKVDEWGNRIRDEVGFPAFALVNKATLKALKHGSEEWDRVGLSYYNENDLDESILWTQSDDVGHGYQCLRPVTNIHLNLDAKLADGKYGNVRDGNELILFRWKKQKNQKWKMLLGPNGAGSRTYSHMMQLPIRKI